MFVRNREARLGRKSLQMVETVGTVGTVVGTVGTVGRVGGVVGGRRQSREAMWFYVLRVLLPNVSSVVQWWVLYYSVTIMTKCSSVFQYVLTTFLSTAHHPNLVKYIWQNLTNAVSESERHPRLANTVYKKVNITLALEAGQQLTCGNLSLVQPTAVASCIRNTSYLSVSVCHIYPFL